MKSYQPIPLVLVFGPIITVAELVKRRFARIPKKKPRNSGGVVV